MGFFSKIKEGLTKTRKAMAETLGNVFSGFSNLDDDFYDELEECLILADPVSYTHLTLPTNSLV